MPTITTNPSVRMTAQAMALRKAKKNDFMHGG
jgi:hypothetical protein